MRHEDSSSYTHMYIYIFPVTFILQGVPHTEPAKQEGVGSTVYESTRQAWYPSFRARVDCGRSSLVIKMTAQGSLKVARVSPEASVPAAKHSTSFRKRSGSVLQQCEECLRDARSLSSHPKIRDEFKQRPAQHAPFLSSFLQDSHGCWACWDLYSDP